MAEKMVDERFLKVALKNQPVLSLGKEMNDSICHK